MKFHFNRFHFMELAFTILAGLGALLILLGYLGFVVAGFKHHFVTGVISALPVLNIVTVPALWRKAGRKVITSLIGLIILIASWFLGANTGIHNVIGMLKGDNHTTQTAITPAPATSNTSIVPIANSQSIPAKPSASPQYTIDESKLQQLPKKALYRMSFEDIPIDKVQSLKDRIVKITTTSNDQLEGKVNKITGSSLTIQGNELPIANIKKISLMVKKAQ